MLYSAQFWLAAIALIACVGHMLKSDKIPLWIAVLLVCIGLIVGAFPK